MKKITKRIMALMLSLVMIIGCIPGLTNEVSADELTIANILPANFPESSKNAWKADNGNYVYLNGNSLSFFNLPNMINYGDALELTINDQGNYILKQILEQTPSDLVFVMEDNKLVEIISYNNECPGTYKPESITSVNVNFKGTLATNINTLEYSVDENEPYTLDEGDKWYTSESLADEYNFANTGDAYKQITLTPKDGYKFNLNPTISIEIKNGELANEPEINNNGELVFIVKVNVVDNFSKTLSITIPTAPGTKIEDIYNSILETLKSTPNTNTAFIPKTGQRIRIFAANNIDDGYLSQTTLESNNEYYVSISIKDDEASTISSVIINNASIPYMESEGDPTNVTNGYGIKDTSINIFYILNLKQSSGSKKYKANSTKTEEKISGSGKKGSKRTITPIEGKKVSSVIVKDKDGNKIDVTLNEDGTYSFIQPASNVDVEVIYKNREITLTIGSTVASCDGENSNLDVAPIIRNDRTMLPIRFIAENLGAKVEWNEKNPNTVIITRGDIKIEITLGSDIMLVNSNEIKLDSVAFAENDRTYLPVRAISEALNAIVEWNENEPSTIKIYER